MIWGSLRRRGGLGEFLDRVFLGTMMIAKFVEWVRFALVEKAWVFVSREFEGFEYLESDFDLSGRLDIHASAYREPVGIFSVTEKCANTGSFRVTRRTAPSCFASGDIYDGDLRAENRCYICNFNKECIGFKE